MSTQDANINLVMDLLDKWWGGNLTWEGIVQIIQAGRGKLLYVDILPLPTSIQGFCVGLRDCDVIGLRQNLDEERLKFTKFHEASHFLLRHIPLLSFEDETPTYAAYQRSYNEWIKKSRHRGLRTDELEQAADVLAYKLLDRVSLSRNNISSAIKEFYLI